LPRAKLNGLYLVPILSKALDILELLEAEKRSLTHEDISQELHFSKTSVYRILKTFVHRGYIAHSQDGRYRVVSRSKKLRFGFVRHSNASPFAEAVTASLYSAASRAGIELILSENEPLPENKYDGDHAIRNAQELLEMKVDLAIEFQLNPRVASLMAHILACANVPLVAVDIPHPHTTYFGVDNFQVGCDAGELLAQHAIERWKGKVDWIVGLEIADACSVVQSRITGAFQGIRSRLPEVGLDHFVRATGVDLCQSGYQVTADFLNSHKKQRILIAAATDTSALGAVQAAREAGLTHAVAIAGQDCSQEVLEEMRLHTEPLIGCVSHQAQTYGSGLVQLGIDLLRGSAVPPYNFVGHKLVTRASLETPEAVLAHAAKHEPLQATVQDNTDRGGHLKSQLAAPFDRVASDTYRASPVTATSSLE
jgi:ribose transport system substrate-binding protein